MFFPANILASTKKQYRKPGEITTEKYNVKETNQNTPSCVPMWVDGRHLMANQHN